VNAYNDISALKIVSGNAKVLTEYKTNPTNGICILLANYSDFYELFLNEDASQFNLRKQNQSIRLSILENANEKSEYKLHSQALIYFQWALVKIKFKDYISAVNDLRKSYKLFKENEKLFPNFKQDAIYINTIESIVGTIPNGYKWVPKLLGIKGNSATAKQNLNKILLENNPQQQMDKIMLCALLQQFVFNNQIEAWKIVKPYLPQCKQNKMFSFLIANIALNNNKAKEALEAITANENKPEFMAVPFLDYQKGSALMYHLDANGLIYFKKFIENYKGKFYLKDAYYKMAMLSYLKNNIADAKKYKALIITKGHSESDADKHALKWAQQDLWPNSELTKARFLCDGGYLKEAELITNKIVNTTLSNDDLIEYNYRIARIADMQNNSTKAIEYYTNTINLGKNSTLYFAARAALQLGNIYENLKNKPQAIIYYKICLAMENHEYKNSIDQKAKAALQGL
jgi:hypothetical protein